MNFDLDVFRARPDFDLPFFLKGILFEEVSVEKNKITCFS